MFLKGCFYVGVSLCRLCVSNIFGARTGFGVDAGHVFLQSVLAVIPLIAGLLVSRACARWEVGSLLCSMAVTTLSGAGSASQMLE